MELIRDGGTNERCRELKRDGGTNVRLMELIIRDGGS